MGARVTGWYKSCGSVIKHWLIAFNNHTKPRSIERSRGFTLQDRLGRGPRCVWCLDNEA